MDLELKPFELATLRLQTGMREKNYSLFIFTYLLHNYIMYILLLYIFYA